MREEALLRRVLRAVKRIQPELGSRAINKGGVIAVGWLRVRVPLRDVIYEWSGVAVAALAVRKDAMFADIAADDAAGSDSSAEWCP